MTDTTSTGGEQPAAQAGSALGGLGARRQVRVARAAEKRDVVAQAAQRFVVAKMFSRPV